MTITPGRLVAILTPVLFAPLAGSICVLAARYLPGVDIDQGRLQAIFITGATIAFGKAALWLKGWQDWEKRQADAPSDIVDLPVDDGKVDADSALAEDTAVAQDPSDEGDPVEEEDPVDGEDLDFDDSDLDDLLGAPVAAGNQGWGP
ncbi:MAG: hypothetical protein ACXVSX_21050 [Solirubrobacteraceae bacterium]